MNHFVAVASFSFQYVPFLLLFSQSNLSLHVFSWVTSNFTPLPPNSWYPTASSAASSCPLILRSPTVLSAFPENCKNAWVAWLIRSISHQSKALNWHADADMCDSLCSAAHLFIQRVKLGPPTSPAVFDDSKRIVHSASWSFSCSMQHRPREHFLNPRNHSKGSQIHSVLFGSYVFASFLTVHNS